MNGWAYCAGDRTLADLPIADREETARYIESHGGAIVLRCVSKHGEVLGSDAKRFMLDERKLTGELPEASYVWVQA